MYAHVRFNDGRESIVSVHHLIHVGKQYDRGKLKLREQLTLVEKRTTEVEEAEFDIHSKPVSKPDIHLLVHSNCDGQHSPLISEDSVMLRRSMMNGIKPLRYH